MAAIAKIISLLPIFLVEYYEVKLIAELNQFFNFDHNIFLLDSSVEVNRFINRQEVIPQSVYVFKSVGDNITGLERLTKVQSTNAFMVVVAKGATFHDNLNLLKQIQTIQKLQRKMKIGMFLPNFASSEDLKTLLEWCKEQLIVKIFAVTYAHTNNIQGVISERFLNIFTFHPFNPLGTFEVTNVTGAQSYNSYFLSLNSNFQKHKLRLVDSIHTPYNWMKFWLTVLKLMNASFVAVPVVLPSGDIMPVMKENQIDVFISMSTMSAGTVSDMYPWEMSAQTIIVPEAEPYSDFSSYLRALTSDEFFVYSFVTIISVVLLLGVIRYIKQKKILVFQSVADVFNLLMNDNVQIQYQRLSRVEVFIIVPLTYIGLVIMNGILSNMQSYLTRPGFQPQIKTIEDIYRSPFAIHTNGEGWRRSLIRSLTNLTKYEDWINKTFYDKKYDKQLEMFNTSKSFFIDMDKVNHLLEVQKRLNIRGFRNLPIQLNGRHCIFMVLEKFLFFERFNEIVHRYKSAGLYDLWDRRQYHNWKRTMLQANVERLKKENESIIGNLEFPMITVYGWLLSVIVFVIEIIWKNLELTRMKFWRILTQKVG